MPTYSNSVLLCEKRNSVIKSFGQGGSVISFAYSAYGARPPRAMAPVIGFNGQRDEPLTGWYALGHGHRVYNPTLQRFHSPDRLSPFGKGGLNAYAYCLGDPVNHEDPTGQFIREIVTGAAVAGAVNRVREATMNIIAKIRNYGRWLVSANYDEYVAHLNDVSIVSAVGGHTMLAAAALMPTATAGNIALGVSSSMMGVNIGAGLISVGDTVGDSLPALREIAGSAHSRLSEAYSVLNEVRGNYWGFKDPSSKNRVPHSTDIIRQS
jgi:RHS repeat-associated protein